MITFVFAPHYIDLVTQDNYSFVGAMSPLSKLVVIVIMFVTLRHCSNNFSLQFEFHRVRGRHRGLPVAVDRAVLLPSDMVPSTSANTVAPDANGITRERKETSRPDSPSRLAGSSPIY